ncbi:hypothetical protein [Streptomyces turgidiscabies]|uniref:hypothetical protein n=1 Tax=Streptomyces turgidiscabies TaxID=85558 RepID=UPI0027D89E4A|nr:hypothetical protein [Streptomyces turgidiscabies]
MSMLGRVRMNVRTSRFRRKDMHGAHLPARRSLLTHVSVLPDGLFDVLPGAFPGIVARPAAQGGRRPRLRRG